MVPNPPGSTSRGKGLEPCPGAEHIRVWYDCQTLFHCVFGTRLADLPPINILMDAFVPACPERNVWNIVQVMAEDGKIVVE